MHLITGSWHIAGALLEDFLGAAAIAADVHNRRHGVYKVVTKLAVIRLSKRTCGVCGKRERESGFPHLRTAVMIAPSDHQMISDFLILATTQPPSLPQLFRGACFQYESMARPITLQDIVVLRSQQPSASRHRRLHALGAAKRAWQVWHYFAWNSSCGVAVWT